MTRRKASPRSRRSRSRRGRPVSRDKSVKRPNARFWGLGGAGALVLSLLAGGLLIGWSFSRTDVRSSEVQSVPLEVRQSASRFEVIDELGRLGLTESPLLMKAYVTLFAPRLRFSPRLHLLPWGMSARETLALLSGAAGRPQAEVTIVEGFHFAQVAQRLEVAGICSRLEFEAAVFRRSLLDSLGIVGPSAEGYLFPARYPFPLDSDAEQVLSRLVGETRKRLARLGAEGVVAPGGLELREHELLTLASIVEKETGRAGERGKVARVFINRLLRPESDTRGRLQSDPTAGYGCLVDPLAAPSCGRSGSGITPAMLRDDANPYNTYRHAGLPPGPICNPGELAIQAALHPSPGALLYFVADGRGGHVFSESYEQHRAAVAKLKQLRASGASP